MEGRESTISVSPTNTETESQVSGGVVPMAVNMNMERTITGSNNNGGGGIQTSFVPKKRRGRPRKYNNSDANMTLPIPSPHLFSPSSSTNQPAKRGRGRPPGSTNRQVRPQVPPSLGDWLANSAGANLTPYVFEMNPGEDIAGRIHAFSQEIPLAVCILSANGSISTVTIRQPCVLGGFLTFEGRFDIISLSGSFSVNSVGGLSVSLTGSDGRIFGGAVAGSLIAASTTQVVLGSFMPTTYIPSSFMPSGFKVQQKRKRYVDFPTMTSKVPKYAGVTAAIPISQAMPANYHGIVASPTSTLPEQNLAEAENSTGSNHNPDNPNFLQSASNLRISSPSKADQKLPYPDINVNLLEE